jgi:hypothetical protein
MSQKPNAEKLVRLPFVPIGPGKHTGYGRNLWIGAGHARPHDHLPWLCGVKEVVDQFHLTGSHPVHPRHGIDGKPMLVQELSRRYHLVRR